MQDWTDAITEWLNDKDEEDFIVVNVDAPIGRLGVSGLLNIEKAYLKMAVLLPAYQGLGSGTRAIRELMNRLRQKGSQNWLCIPIVIIKKRRLVTESADLKQLTI